MRRAMVLAALLLAALPAAAGAQTVRVFAVGPRFSPDWVQSRAAFHDKIAGMAARDVTPYRRGGGRDLIALPEDLGLMAAFTGERGTQARAADGLVGAIVALMGSYAPVSAYYGEKYPELTKRPLPTRQLVVGLTDTFARTAVETFAEIADANDAYLVAGVNMAHDWQVVCVDRAAFRPRPGAPRCAEESPAKVALLRSPDEPDRDYAYEATSPDAVNMALVFDPAGRLVSKQVKTYLTPIELPASLDLVPGPVSGLTRVDTPAGRLGVVTSKDAWMPDVLSRLDAAGVDVLVQPEFFVGDTVGPTGMWAPDNIKASGYSAVLRNPSLDALVLPSLTGNVFDFSADNQSQVVIKPRSARAPRGQLVGQQPAPGFKAVAPWAVADPLGRPLMERRRILAAAGQKLLPQPGNPPCPTPAPGPCRGGQVEATVRADVEVAPRRPLRRTRPRATAPFGSARPLAPSSREQRNVALAARARAVWAAFEDGGSVRLARSRNGGRTWARPVRLGPGNWPAVAAGAGGRVWAVWQQGRQVVLRVSSDGGRRFSRARAVSAAGAPQWKPAIAATGRDSAYVAWVDERGRQVEGGLPRASVWGARIAGPRVAGAAELDTSGPLNDNAEQLDNDWAPTVGARGRDVVVAWTDFRTYDWRIVARRSRDGGARFGAIVDVNDTPKSREAINDAPRAVVGRRGPALAWTDFRSDATMAEHPLYGIRTAGLGGPNRRVGEHRATQALSANPAIALTAAGRVLIAWQDHLHGVGAIRIGAHGLPVSRSGANQWRPALAVSGGQVLAAWEDERDGPSQVYLAAAPAGRIG